jgi:hypothetical protein
VSKDAKAAFAVAARIFVSYCTAMANEIAMESNRKTLNAMDVGAVFLHFRLSIFRMLLFRAYVAQRASLRVGCRKHSLTSL